MPSWYRWSGAVCALAVTLFAGATAADVVVPVEITMVGPGPVRLRVARGNVAPCDSPEDRMIVQRKFNAGSVVRTATDACVCVQHTFQPFIDIDWSQAVFLCRPMICTGRGRAAHCVPAPDPTIRVRVHSRRPD